MNYSEPGLWQVSTLKYLFDYVSLLVLIQITFRQRWRVKGNIKCVLGVFIYGGNIEIMFIVLSNTF